MAWRFAKAKLAAAHMAPKYACPSLEWNGAQASSRSGSLIAWRAMTASMDRT
jgi:hypothetical protein